MDPWWDLPVLIRPATSDDLGRMLELNNAAVPAVNELTLDEMESLWQEAKKNG